MVRTGPGRGLPFPRDVGDGTGGGVSLEVRNRSNVFRIEENDRLGDRRERRALPERDTESSPSSSERFLFLGVPRRRLRPRVVVAEDAVDKGDVGTGGMLEPVSVALESSFKLGVLHERLIVGA